MVSKFIIIKGRKVYINKKTGQPLIILSRKELLSIFKSIPDKLDLKVRKPKKVKW